MGKLSSTRPYSLNPNRCFMYYAKNSNDQPVIQRAEFLPSNKIFASGNFQIQIFKTYEFHKDSYASHARIQHNIIMFNQRNLKIVSTQGGPLLLIRTTADDRTWIKIVLGRIGEGSVGKLAMKLSDFAIYSRVSKSIWTISLSKRKSL